MRPIIRTVDERLKTILGMLDNYITNGNSSDVKIIERCIEKINTIREDAEHMVSIEMRRDGVYVPVSYDECCTALVSYAGEVLEVLYQHPYVE